MNQREIEPIEIQALLQALFLHSGYDFRSYSPACMRRRILNAVAEEKLPTISRLQESILRDPQCLQRFLLRLTVQVTAMFRDPEFYLAFRERVVPILKTYPSLNFWVAGCCNGEEVYSMALLLREEGLAKKSTIYATDLHEDILALARAGKFPIGVMQDYTRNYMRAGGRRPFSDYYKVANGYAILDHSLKANIIFAQHNLATDRSFNEFQVILCRNVLIYFNQALQNQVHGLLHESLVPLGILGLGQKETMQFTSYSNRYFELDNRNKIYRKVF